MHIIKTARAAYVKDRTKQTFRMAYEHQHSLDEKWFFGLFIYKSKVNNLGKNQSFFKISFFSWNILIFDQITNHVLEMLG